LAAARQGSVRACGLFAALKFFAHGILATGSHRGVGVSLAALAVTPTPCGCHARVNALAGWIIYMWQKISDAPLTNHCAIEQWGTGSTGH